MRRARPVGVQGVLLDPRDEPVQSAAALVLVIASATSFVGNGKKETASKRSRFTRTNHESAYRMRLRMPW